MKVYLPFFISCICLLIACNSQQTKSGIPADSIAAADDPNMDDGDFFDTLSCADLDNRKIIYDQLKENDSYGFINYDTSNVMVVRGHFISKDSISTLVFIPGDSGPPCGTGCNMILLYSCGEKARLVFSGWSGWFSEDDIEDLNNDGILEIITGYEIMNMGECGSYYQIKNYASGKENILHESSSYSVVECGGGDETIGRHKKGDTIGIDVTSELIDPENDHIFEVKEFRKYRIHNGGKTEDQVVENEIHKYDTIIVPLK
jgi:hypothetical protein